MVAYVCLHHVVVLSPRNLKFIRKFAEEYPDLIIVQQAVAQLS